MILSPVAMIVLISSASRTSISGLAGFWLVYYLLGNYQNMRVTTKAMMFTAIVFVCFLLVATVDLGKVWYDFVIYSGRLENYTTPLLVVAKNNIWLAGLGFNFVERLNRLRTVTYLDSFYLWTFLESGVIGFILLIGTIICFAFMYFRDTRYMTKFHRLAGGLLAVMLWYGLFESRMYSNRDAIDMANWILLIAAVNERCSLINSHRGVSPTKTHNIPIRLMNPHENRLEILHNS